MADELLCTVDDVADAWPGFSKLSATRQASLVSRASQAVLDHCRRGFIAMSVLEAADGEGLSRIWLKRPPIIVVETVSINGVPLDNTDGTAWYFKTKSGELGLGQGFHDARFGLSFPSGRGNISVQYWGGFPSVPDPVIEATIQTCQWMAIKARVSGVYQSESIGDYSYTLAARPAALALGMPEDIAALLAEYVLDDAFA